MKKLIIGILTIVAFTTVASTVHFALEVNRLESEVRKQDNALMMATKRIEMLKKKNAELEGCAENREHSVSDRLGLNLTQLFDKLESESRTIDTMIETKSDEHWTFDVGDLISFRRNGNATPFTVLGKTFKDDGTAAAYQLARGSQSRPVTKERVESHARLVMQANTGTLD